MADRAYVDGLKMLARRELSEAQVRQRLARSGHAKDDIERAVARLREERAIDDERVAGAIARTAVSLKKRGRLRATRQIEQAGIARSVAARAVADVYGEVDGEALLDAALAKRLRVGARIADDRQFQRLYRYLLAQGFESDRIMAALNARRR